MYNPSCIFTVIIFIEPDTFQTFSTTSMPWIFRVHFYPSLFLSRAYPIGCERLILVVSLLISSYSLKICLHFCIVEFLLLKTIFCLEYIYVSSASFHLFWFLNCFHILVHSILISYFSLFQSLSHFYLYDL